MSLYNLVNGFNPGCFYLAPMLTDQNPQQYFPRFRDCFLSEDMQYIDVYTRCGGGNRDTGLGEELLYAHPDFVTTWDDEFDSTYATYRFSVPDEWVEDFKAIVDGRLKDVSESYKQRVETCFKNIENVREKLFGENAEPVITPDGLAQLKPKAGI